MKAALEGAGNAAANMPSSAHNMFALGVATIAVVIATAYVCTREKNITVSMSHNKVGKNAKLYQKVPSPTLFKSGSKVQITMDHNEVGEGAIHNQNRL